MKKTTAEQDPKAAQKLRELIKDISVAMITTVTHDGALRSRPMVTQETGGEGLLWFLLSDASGAASDLKEERAVNVAYADVENDRYVSISGNASVVHDTERLQDLWDDSLTKYFPKGLDDPHLALLQVRVETAEYWDTKRGQMVGLHDASHTPNEQRHVDDEHTQIAIRATPTSG